MNKKYLTNKNGYLVIHRGIQRLLQDIGFSLFAAYIGFVCEAGWDRRYDTYRAILPNDSELAILWGCHESTVFRNKKALVKFGLLEQIKGVTYIKNMDLFN